MEKEIGQMITGFIFISQDKDAMEQRTSNITTLMNKKHFRWFHELSR